ncbi:hypothetical protein HD554DRAFT_2084070 [Boletus coccyginus]|nr:hypothetical protein HD554DRAFT_2084070 [Boletus coccyginus]
MPMAAILASRSRCVFYWPSPSYEPTHSQLVDDILDLLSSTTLGKPGSGTDLRLGLATSPVLYPAEEYPELEPLIAREFKHDGDVEWMRIMHHYFFASPTTFPHSDRLCL